MSLNSKQKTICAREKKFFSTFRSIKNQVKGRNVLGEVAQLLSIRVRCITARNLGIQILMNAWMIFDEDEEISF